MINNNKKGYSTQIFGLFFILFIFSSLFMFMTFGLHYILYDYGINELENVAGMVLTNTTSITTLGESYLNLSGYYDILFLVLLFSLFIESTISAVKARESGFLSFFGFVTIGNVFLIFILSYASQIQGWILNDLIFNVILVSIDTPVLTTFFNYSMFIAVFWYLWLLGINQINLAGLKERFNQTFTRGGETPERLNDEDLTARFEQ